MKISSKGRYAVRILIDIATSDKEYVSISEISERQGISIKYLEKIMNILVKGKLVESLLGQKGGYKLSKSPKKCSVAEIFSLTGDAPVLAPCQISPNKCPKLKNCTTIGYWENLQKLIYGNLEKISLQDIIDKNY